MIRFLHILYKEVFSIQIFSLFNSYTNKKNKKITSMSSVKYILED